MKRVSGLDKSLVQTANARLHALVGRPNSFRMLCDVGLDVDCTRSNGGGKRGNLPNVLDGERSLCSNADPASRGVYCCCVCTYGVRYSCAFLPHLSVSPQPARASPLDTVLSAWTWDACVKDSCGLNTLE